MTSVPDLDTWGLNGAEWISTKSKDPSKKVGALILRENGTIASAGYNGFPKGTNDDPALYLDKTIKRRRIQHAERNAITFATESLKGCSIYVSPLHPCSQCAGSIINAGISKVIARIPPGVSSDYWRDDFAEAASMFKEAGVEVVVL